MRTVRDQEETARLWSRLTAGYSSLTLDPSPNLRQMHRELSPHSKTVMQSAWTSVGSALVSAMRSAAQGLRADRSS
jgi:hypothetical protein